VSIRQLNLLIVDDEPTTVRVIRSYLEQEFADRITIHAFTCPKDAQRWIECHCADIVISDIEMPDMSGVDLLRFAKARNAWTQMIIMTGHSTWEHIATCIEHGASDYLLKPVDRRDLIELVQQEWKRFSRWQTAVAATMAVNEPILAD
jgi:YesN/AraC family two-component response regulator